MGKALVILGESFLSGRDTGFSLNIIVTQQSIRRYTLLQYYTQHHYCIEKLKLEASHSILATGEMNVVPKK